MTQLPGTTPLVVVTNCPSEDVADRIATHLVEQRLAACVNRLAPVSSIYRWQGAVERAREWPLLIKTTTARYVAVEAAIAALHPYSVPEVIALPLYAGLPAYLQWVADETRDTDHQRA